MFAAFFTVDFRLTELQVLHDIGSGVPQVLQNVKDSDDRVRTMAALAVVSFLGAAVSWLVWQFRSQANVRALGAQGLRFRPSAAVAAWFVPVVDLVVPPLAVAELWKASEPGTEGSDWKKQSSGPIVWLWWAFWLATLYLAGMALRLGLQSHASWISVTGLSSFSLSSAAAHANVAKVLSRDHFMIGAAALSIPAAALAILLLVLIEGRQDVKHFAPQGRVGGVWSRERPET